MIDNLQLFGIGALGALVGFVAGVWTTWSAYKAAKKEVGITAAPSGQLSCGACGSPIMDAPSHVVVTATEAFRYYKCKQCATVLTVALPTE
jgi:hypothetical protein